MVHKWLALILVVSSAYGCGGTVAPGTGPGPDGGDVVDATPMGDAEAILSTGSGADASWVKTELARTTESIFASAVADASGNVVVAGQLWGPSTVDFGNGVMLTGASARYSALLVKYDSSGTAQWGRVVAVDSNGSGSGFGSVALDSSGNLYAAGYLSGVSGTVDFGNGVTIIKSDTFNDGVLVKYDSSGTAQWAQLVTDGSSDSFFNSVAVDTSDNLYVAGEIDGAGAYHFGDGVTATGTVVDAGSNNIPGNSVLAKYNSSGVALWAQAVVAGSPDSSFNSVAVDSTGNAFAAGSIAGTATYDFGNGVTATGAANGGPIAGQAADNSVVVKYDSSGVAQWAQTPSAGSGGSYYTSVAVDSAGNAYVAGAMGGPGTYDFGHGVTATGSLNSGAFTGLEGPQYVVLVNYDSSGIAKWAQTVTNGGPNSYFDSVAIDSSGNVYAAGSVYGYSPGTYDFGNGAIVAPSLRQSNCVLLVEYSSSGVPQWARSAAIGGASDAIYTSVTVDPANHVFAAGGIGGTGLVDFGNNVTATGPDFDSGLGWWSALLVKYQ